ncbi:Periplasmic pH-dependent serine endoprotease DegQ precursor [Planctomycetes bacterium Pan216]|uniref:Periplasmic pH-dependent serine endoprotease DegQ n=1 Tax=Kolteria novifilia TaxID=2527975 RepID=A0A518B171_9BACT|nr:Periplasmic pH-dependent serine endoprotease DegQ precursor [Planctomycetes bacterium Pan216]
MLKKTFLLLAAGALMIPAGIYPATALAAAKARRFLGIGGNDAAVGSERQGVFVSRVAPDSPAEKAGLLPGDIITAVEGTPIANFRELVANLSQVDVGKTVNLSIWRGGQEMKVAATLAAMPEGLSQPDARLAPQAQGWPLGGQAFSVPAVEPRPMIGVQLQDLSDALRKRLGLEDQAGALVADVIANSPAAKAGLESPDLISGVDGTPVTSPQELSEILATKKPGEAVTLGIVRDGESKEVSVTLEEMRLPARRTIPPSAPQMAPGFGAPLGGNAMPFTVVPTQELNALRQRVADLEKQVKDLHQQLGSEGN